MVNLTRKEILTELKKLGMYTPSQLKTYVKQYMVRYNTLYLNSPRFKHPRKSGNQKLQ